MKKIPLSNAFAPTKIVASKKKQIRNPQSLLRSAETLKSKEINRKPCVYLCGPMSGLQFKNFPTFNAVARGLRTEGYPVINPADFGDRSNDHDNPGDDWNTALKRDLAIMLQCEVVVLLPGWENSRGACLEVHVARQIGMKVIEYVELAKELS